MIRNTVLLSLYTILWTFPIPIILSLIMNKLRMKRFKKIAQTILYAPHFVSIMIVCGMLKSMYSFSTAVGLFNTVVNIILLIIVNKIAKKTGRYIIFLLL